MSLIRPAARDAVHRWQGVALALAVVALGTWAGTRGGWLFGAVGIALSAIGLAMAWDALQRLRFRDGSQSDGPGSVEIDEGQITWFGPGIGGSLSLADLTEVGLITLQGLRVWRLVQRDGQHLLIPTGAEGADRLYDALTGLPGIEGGKLLAAIGNAGDTPLVWSRRPARILPFPAGH